MSGRARSSVVAGLSVACLVLLVWATFLFRAELTWREAEEGRDAGDHTAAVRAARAVFDLYAPGSPRLEAASELIWSVAEAAEAGGERAAALESYRLLRSAWIAADPLGGNAGWVDRAEIRIARLASGASLEEASPASGPAKEREAALLAEMRAPGRPRAPWGLVTALGFAAWVGGTVGLIARGFGQDGRLGAGSLLWVGFLAVGYLAWIIGMVRA
jgi:hypothetical protein